MPAWSAFTTILPLVGIPVATALGYLSGRLLQTRKQLVLQKGQAYADCLEALAISATDSRSMTAIAMAADAKTRVCIYGSHAVIKQLSAFEQVGAKISSDESGQVVVHLLAAMRNDMGPFGRKIDEMDLHYVLFGSDR